jgi:large subunit ribosomal protein L15
MRLNELTNDRNKRKSPKRVGRGIGSGTGKTGGRGQKGQTSRSGVSINGFEGGQMPIFRRVPKRGFSNPFRVEYQCVSLDSLQEFIDNGSLDASKPINKQNLLESGIINRKLLPVKILANGVITSSITIEVDSASKGSIKAIEKSGGKVTVTVVKKAEAA